MHIKRRFVKSITAGLILAITLTGCSGKKEDDDADSPAAVTEAPASTPTDIPVTVSVTTLPEPTQIPEETHESEVRSFLTNEWIPKEYADNRPYAIMFNNLELASPQSGIGEADILYEALAEGGITRLMGIYDYIDPESEAAERIGSVRSARHYFASFADEYEAIFIHYGWTSYAQKKIKSIEVDSVNGTQGCGTESFYRDKSIEAPHNAFASLEGILKGIQRGGYETKLSENHNTNFGFYDEDTTPDSEIKAVKITLPFSQYVKPYLVYNTDNGLYTRYQFDEVHTDYNTGEPLEFKNIIVQYVIEKNIDANGYQTMEIENNSGTGIYITNGVCTDITWKKNESEGFMKYYDADGNELCVNTGKTFIAVFPVASKDKITLE